MKTLERRILETLDPAGVALVIRGALGRGEMVRIANASRVSVPGMRNRSVSLEHLSSALADKFVAEGPSRRLILKALQAAVRPLAHSYRRTPAEDLRQRLTDPERVRADSELGKWLYLLIQEPKEGIASEDLKQAVAEALRTPVPRESEPSPSGSPLEAELQALKREKADLSRRAADLVAHVDRLRERDRRFREEIAQRKFDVNNLKLQVTKLKKERESMERELRALAVRVDQADKKPLTLAEISDKASAGLAETRRLAAAVEKLQTRLPKEERAPAPSAAVKALEEYRRMAQEQFKTLGSEAGKILKALAEQSTRLDDILRLQGGGDAEAPRRGGLDRVGIFVDVQNMFYAARGQNARLDFDALLQAATRGRRLVRAIAYVVEAKEINQSGFIALLQQKRYEVKRKDLKVRADGSSKGDWDMEIALDALEMADTLDVVVLVTGDGDFTSLVQKLKVKGPRIEVYSFPQNTAKELREAADRFIPIDKRMLIRLPRSAAKAAPSGPPRSGAPSQ